MKILADIVVRFRVPIIIVSVLSIAFMVYSMKNFRVQTDILKIEKENSIGAKNPHLFRALNTIVVMYYILCTWGCRRWWSV